MKKVAGKAKRTASRLVAVALGACLVAGWPLAPASAQVQPQPPTRDDLALGQAGARTAASRLTVEGDIERGPCPLADPSFAGTRVSFSTVSFSGLPGVPPSALDAAWQGFAGPEQPIAVLCEVRDRAASILRGMGYLAAVQIPPQEIENGGIVRMDVLAARLIEVQLRGDAGNSERLIAAHVQRLTERPWFNTREAERHLLLLQDLPGYDVRLILRSAGGAPGEVFGDIVVTRRPVEMVLGAQNLGARVTGREGVFAVVTLNDLLGRGDRSSASYYNTLDWSEQRILRLTHDLALDADGLRLGAGVLLGRSKPDVGGAPFKTETFAIDASLSYPVLRRQEQSLFVRGGFELIDQELSFGKTLLSDDQLRVFFARLDHEQVDRNSVRGIGGFSMRQPRWRSAMSLEVRQGISGLGASKDCRPLADCLAPNTPISNFGADPSSFVARANGRVEFRPVPLLTVASSVIAQVSDGSLLSYEQASLGNYTIGRGFDAGVAVGDHAIGASVELRYGSLYARRRDAFGLEPFVFFDAGQAWAYSAATPDPRRVLSAGGGIRGRWGDRADFGVTLAVPLERAGYQTTKSDARLLFTLTTRLLPWGDR